MENQIKCPKCGSTQIHAEKKGYSAGRAAAGVVLTGGVGLLAGAIGKNDIIITCLKCGKQFKPGEGDASHPISNSPSVDIKYKAGESNIVICSQCGGRTTYGHCYCCECGKQLGDEDKNELSKEPLPLTTCSSCKQLSTKPGLYCSKCGKSKNSKNSGCAGVILLFILLTGTLAIVL